jgi:exodeoxyribonuclease VII small subunit
LRAGSQCDPVDVDGLVCPRYTRASMAAKSDKAPRRRARVSSGEAPGPSAEALLTRLDEVVRELESGELPLEQALARFEEGVKLVRDGEQLLASVEQRIEMLLANGEIVPFAEDEDYAEDEHPDPRAQDDES